jgi:putative NADH-flavin reductase
VNIVVFGATGRTGQPLVKQALAAGHTVTAYVRDPAKLDLNHAKLRVVQGQLNDPAKLEAAVRGQYAVLSALGPVKGGSKTVMEEAARNLTIAMKNAGVHRLITLTGAGVAQPGDEPKAFNRFMSFMLNLMAKDVLLDSAKHAETVRRSGLEWTIVRVPMLTDDPHTGRYRVGKVGVDDGPRISRADVADFMLKQLSDKTYIGQAPVISY